MPLNVPSTAASSMLGMRRPGSRVERDAPQRLEQLARRVVGDVAVARQLVRERAHVAGALHVVLAAQRVHADAGAADIAGRHGEVGDRHHRGRALAVLGDAEAVIDRAVAAGGVEPRRGAQIVSAGTPVTFASRFRASCCGSATNAAQSSNSFQSQRSRTKALVDQAFGDDDMGQRGEHRDVGAGQQRQMIGGLDMRRCARGRCGADRSTISLAPSRSRFFMREANTGWPSVGLAPMTMMTSVCSTESKSCVPAEVPKVGLQAVAGRRMADAGAGVDVVVAEAGADQLLHQDRFPRWCSATR